MVLFHGSRTRNIDKFRIIPREQNTPKFGDGVYFTSSYHKALEWSCNKSREGMVYKVDIDLSTMNGIEIKTENELYYYVSYLHRIDLKEIADDCIDEIRDKDYIFGDVLRQSMKSVRDNQ